MTNNETIQDPVTDELLSWIESATRRLCASAGGLTDQQARTIVMPSGWSIAGLIGHVHDSTWFWLHHVAVGHPVDFDDKDWDNDPALAFPELLERVRRDTAQGCAEVRALPSTAEPGWWPEGAWGGYRQDTIRGVLIHLLNDNAAHSGQLDIVREQLDGGVWDYGRRSLKLPGAAV
ncbi:mycothiol transferase [Nakamurella lactea]|jgi:uncharacterized damage-inducible protein DinB|uniref:mycothiol transferase n=1 Tax=Nakamurella lactea TaxID=459515 RepID=UPI0004911719|nr:DUF664 domain-containing protein [Nakamurella lactea]